MTRAKCIELLWSRCVWYSHQKVATLGIRCARLVKRSHSEHFRVLTYIFHLLKSPESSFIEGSDGDVMNSLRKFGNWTFRHTFVLNRTLYRLTLFYFSPVVASINCHTHYFAYYSLSSSLNFFLVLNWRTYFFFVCGNWINSLVRLYRSAYNNWLLYHFSLIYCGRTTCVYIGIKCYTLNYIALWVRL